MILSAAAYFGTFKDVKQISVGLLHLLTPCLRSFTCKVSTRKGGTTGNQSLKGAGVESEKIHLV